MASDIKETPLLNGEDAKRFIKKIKQNETQKTSPEEYERVMKNYHKIKPPTDTERLNWLEKNLKEIKVSKYSGFTRITTKKNESFSINNTAWFDSKGMIRQAIDKAIEKENHEKNNG